MSPGASHAPGRSSAGENPPPSPDAPIRHGPRLRVVLSLFFVLHFGSIAVYHLPWSEPDLAGLPPAVSEPAGALLPPVKRLAWPVVRRYLDATATRQRWTLFAPWPAEWGVSLDVEAFYPVTEAPTAADDSLRWTADTVRVTGAEEVPYPHFTRHRTYRVVFNMGYEVWGAHYRPVYARWLCRTLEDERGRSPDGVTLTARWRRTDIPWREGQEPRRYEQFLGGFSCHDVLGREPPPHLTAWLEEGDP